MRLPSCSDRALADLAKARAHYNQRQFDDAIMPRNGRASDAETADAAAIVLARAHLERYRERADPADLSAAREVLGAIRASSLDATRSGGAPAGARQSLFLEDDFGAAAEMFESGLERAASTDRSLAEAMLEWWGSAIERQAGALRRGYRAGGVSPPGRAHARGAGADTRRPPPRAYWTVVALRGAGEPERAWDAAVAGWVRARLIGDRAPTLRADLDRLVLNGIIPDRVRHLPKDSRPAPNRSSRRNGSW